MDKRNLKRITWGIVTVTVLIVMVMLMNTLHRPGKITLPDPEISAGDSANDAMTDDSALTVVEIRPDTVQAAIATLARPEHYRRTVTVEQFWEGGSGKYDVSVIVSEPWTRTDRTMPDGRVRHTVTGAENVHIWYNNERTVYTAPVGSIAADREQGAPTYEEILFLSVEDILQADYRTISEINCIYVEAAGADPGKLLRYWVSVDTGLLVAAEKLEGEETVYRMGSLTVDQTEPTAEDFILPDGTVLMVP